MRRRRRRGGRGESRFPCRFDRVWRSAQTKCATLDGARACARHNSLLPFAWPADLAHFTARPTSLPAGVPHVKRPIATRSATLGAGAGGATARSACFERCTCRCIRCAIPGSMQLALQARTGPGSACGLRQRPADRSGRTLGSRPAAPLAGRWCQRAQRCRRRRRRLVSDNRLDELPFTAYFICATKVLAPACIAGSMVFDFACPAVTLVSSPPHECIAGFPLSR